HIATVVVVIRLHPRRRRPRAAPDGDVGTRLLGCANVRNEQLLVAFDRERRRRRLLERIARRDRVVAGTNRDAAVDELHSVGRIEEQRERFLALSLRELQQDLPALFVERAAKARERLPLRAGHGDVCVRRRLRQRAVGLPVRTALERWRATASLARRDERRTLAADRRTA